MNDKELARKRKVDVVRRNQTVMRERRSALAAQFKAELLTEIGVEKLAASQASLVNACVSAHVQISELSMMFLSGRASPKQMEALNLARSSLSRLLRQLGLVATDGEKDAQPQETLEAFIARHDAEKQAAQ